MVTTTGRQSGTTFGDSEVLRPEGAGRDVGRQVWIAMVDWRPRTGQPVPRHRRVGGCARGRRRGGGMKTLFPAWRVTDLSASLGFYTALGYTVLGKVVLDNGGSLAVLAFPDEPSASLELVHRPGGGPVVVGGFDHLAVQVDDLAATLERFSLVGLRPGQIGRASCRERV